MVETDRASHKPCSLTDRPPRRCDVLIAQTHAGTGPPNCKTWSPYYTVHKIVRGLYDACTLAGQAPACDVGLGMLSYFARRIRAVIARGTLTAWWPVLQNEFGGMNEVAALFAQLTGDEDARFVGAAFNSPMWLGPLALDADILSGNRESADSFARCAPTQWRALNRKRRPLPLQTPTCTCLSLSAPPRPLNRPGTHAGPTLWTGSLACCATATHSPRAARRRKSTGVTRTSSATRSW